MNLVRHIGMWKTNKKIMIYDPKNPICWFWTKSEIINILDTRETKRRFYESSVKPIITYTAETTSDSVLLLYVIFSIIGQVYIHICIPGPLCISLFTINISWFIDWYVGLYVTLVFGLLTLFVCFNKNYKWIITYFLSFRSY